MRRVYWISTGLMNQSGGGERIILEGLQTFRALGFDPRLVLIRKSGQLKTLFNGRYSPTVVILEKENEEGSRFKSPRWIAIRRELSTILREAGQGDLVIANGPDECRLLLSTRMVSLHRLPPYVTFLHGSKFQFADEVTKYCLVYRGAFSKILDSDDLYRSVIPSRGPRIGILRRIAIELRELVTCLAVRRSSCLIVLSEKMKKEQGWLYRHPHIAVASPGGFSSADLARKEYEDIRRKYSLAGEKLFLSICRLEKKKRVDFLIKAFSIFLQAERKKEYRLVIGGSGPEKGNLESLCRDLAIDRYVLFTGFIPDDQLESWYHGCDVFVHADNADYDLTTMKALGMRVRVVATDQFDFPAHISALRRYIFVSRNREEDFAFQMKRAIEADVSGEQAGDAAELEKLTWERYFQFIAENTSQITLEAGKNRGERNHT